jgi:hypothetical protein
VFEMVKNINVVFGKPMKGGKEEENQKGSKGLIV